MTSRTILSVSFSRGFGLTGSQLGVALVHRDHPLRRAYETQWSWLTYFFNGIAARAFMALDMDAMARTDAARRAWVMDWLRANDLPAVETAVTTWYGAAGDRACSHFPLWINRVPLARR
jgi:hypothetical protein